MKHNLLKSLIISVILLMGVSNAWAWYVPGTIHEERWNKDQNNMYKNNMYADNSITFYAVPAGTYEFRLSDGNTLSGHQCISENKSTGIITDITTNGQNTKFTIKETKDITIKVVDEQKWNVSIEATGPTYHIKAPWNGTDWSWKEFNNQGDGTYSLLNTYTNSTNYNYIKISSDEETAKYYRENATLVNSPSSTSDNCIYTFNPSNGSLEIRKCNTVKFPYHIYFDNSIANWPSDKLQFVVGHASYGRGHVLTSIANTKLYHVHITNWNWPDAGYYAIVSEPNTFGEGGWSRKNLTDNADHYSKAYLDPLNIEQNQSYLFKTEHANNGTPISITKKTQSSELNHTQTVQYVVSKYAGTPAIMNSGTTPGKITISSYKFTNGTYNAVSSVSANLAAQSTTYSTSFTAAQTATTTLTVSEIDDAYQFDGWYDENGTQLETDLTYTYYPTETKTIYARFSEKPYTVTLHPVSDSRGNSGYGHFIVDYKGTRYTSSATETVTFEVAPGSTITIVESQHNYPEIFNGDLCWKKSSEVNFEDWRNINNPVNYPIIVNDNIEIGENFVVRKEAVDRDITPNAGVYVFLRIPKSLEHNNEGGWNHGQWDDNSPHEDLGYPKNKFANFVYLKATNTPGHEVRGSKDADRGCADAGQEAGHFLMDTVHIADDQFSTYYCIITDSCWSTVKFERKHADSDAGQGQITCADVQSFPGGKNNCFTITGRKDDGAFIGTWGPAPKCKVTLGYTDIGRFGVEYNGEVTYEDKAKQEDGLRDDAVIEVPFDAEIKVLAGEPGNDAFVNSMLYIDETGKKTKLDFTEQTTSYTFTVRGDVTVDDLFGTKQDYIIYIGIPKNEDGSIREEFKDWDLDCQQPDHPNKDQMYIWCHWPYDGFGLSGNEYYGSQALIKRTDVIDTDEKYLFYQYTLPKGIYTFNFQCKENKDQNNTSPEHAASIFHYNPPLTTADCFILTGDKNDGKYAGYWTAMPSDGDFRILYVEQIVTKKEKVGDEWITEVKRTYEHSSDFIKPSELNTKGQKIVSLHIYTRGNNPEIILQKYDGEQTKWIDIEAHMVNGPLETDDPGMGLLPGRKNATPGSDIDDFVYDDGIEKIKNDPTDDGCGVWNFTVYKNGENAKLDLFNGLERYNGRYYIRTDNAEGQWIDYKKPTNYMTFSPYAKQHHGEYFSHYFCKWVDTKQHYRDVSFIVANDYAQSLTDPSYLFNDQYVDNQWLPESTNIRWGWSIINNKVSRAYIAGSYNGQNEFLVVNGQDSKVTLQANINGFNGYFNDNTNWLYYADLDAQPEAQVIVRAKYNTKYQFFMGKSDQYQKLIGGDYENDKRYYPIRILYDFKEHRFVVGYHPEEQIVGKDVAIETPVMLIREHHNAPNQISFDNTTRTIEAPMPAYGVITFLEDKLKDPNISKNEKMFYWVSFPFDVRISHAFGLGEYGSHWVMEEYDGEARAEEGWNIYNTFWKYITDTATTLQAGKGYVLCLNYNKVINEAFLSDAAYEKISLYFPSIEEVDQSTIKKQDPKDITIPTWTGRAPTKDHNWNLIGAISYANTGETTQQSNAKFLYEYQPATDTYSPKSSHSYTFNALHAYMVQYGGKITWNNFIAPQSIAAKRDTDSDNDIHALSLDLICNGTVQDQTFIQLEDGEATQMFDLNIDMTKIINSGSNIYSFSTDNNKLAGSVLPIEEAIIPLGVVSAAAGEYTFAMPEGTDGIVVELIDYENNTRTNMLLDNYTVNLGKGTFDNRFALHVKPDKTTTSVDNIGNEATGDKVKKYLIDGVLYMQKDGVLYDAQGKLVR